MATSITAIRVCYWLKSTMAYNELFYVVHFSTNELVQKKSLSWLFSKKLTSSQTAVQVQKSIFLEF